jgi:HEAT repeat protein
MSGREEVDVWSAMLGVLADAQPEAFTTAVVEGAFGRKAHTDTLILVCLKDIPDPRATGVLIRALDASDWPARYHAVRGLAGRDTDETNGALARALDDPEEMIRTEACRALRRKRR